MAMFSPISHPNQSALKHNDSPAMSQPNSSESDSLVPAIPERHWLEWLLKWGEYISLASSAIGTLVVAISGQAFYGVAPLTVAVSLNFANRNRLQQTVVDTQANVVEVEDSVEVLEQKAVRAILGMRQQLRGDIEALQGQLETSPSEDELTIAHRSKQVAVLTDSVASFQTQISEALDEVERQFQQEIAPLQESITELQTAIAQLRANQGTSGKSETFVSQGIGDLSQMQGELDRISKENETIIKPHIKRLLLVVKQLQQAEGNDYLPRPPKPNTKQG